MTAQPADLGPRAVIRLAARAAALAWRCAPGALLAQVAVTAVGGLAPVAAAWLTRALLDRLATGADWPALAGPAFALAGVGTAAAAMAQAARYLAAELDRRVGRHTEGALFDAINGFHGLARLEDPGVQDRLQLAQQAGRAGPGRLVTGCLQATQGGLTVVGFLGGLAVTGSWLAVVVLAGAVPSALVTLSLSRQRARSMWATGHAHRRQSFYARLLSTPDAAKEIRLFGLGPFFRDRMLAEVGAINDVARKLDRRQVTAQAALGTLGAAIAGAGLLWVVMRAAHGRLSIGDVAVFVAAVAGVQSGLAAVIDSGGAAHEALLLFAHYRAIVTAGPDLPVPPLPVPVPALRQAIILRDVWFRYSTDHPWVLRGVDLDIPAGRTTALVGLNGAGKSTLIKLLCRFYDPDRGTVRWDGVDVRAIDPAGLRDRIAAVFQDFRDYDLSAAENVAVGDLTALGDPGRIEEAARRAGIHATLAALPRGYDTLLTRTFYRGADRDDPQHGVLLSGGQWQRVALARAFLRHRRDLLILDEPSAGLDVEAEWQVQRSLRVYRHGGTNVLISHRLSAVRDADHIVVLDDGRVVERGTHDELMAAGGRYARLFALQARGYAAEPVAAAP
jgi:ATP-binding cassette, subfamily B, bacterial